MSKRNNEVVPNFVQSYRGVKAEGKRVVTEKGKYSAGVVKLNLRFREGFSIFYF